MTQSRGSILEVWLLATSDGSGCPWWIRGMGIITDPPCEWPVGEEEKSYFYLVEGLCGRKNFSTSERPGYKSSFCRLRKVTLGLGFLRHKVEIKYFIGNERLWLYKWPLALESKQGLGVLIYCVHASCWRSGGGASAVSGSLITGSLLSGFFLGLLTRIIFSCFKQDKTVLCSCF